MYNDCPAEKHFTFLPEPKPFKNTLALGLGQFSKAGVFPIKHYPYWPVRWASTDRYFHLLSCHIEQNETLFATYSSLSQLIANLAVIFEKVFLNLTFPVPSLLLEDFENFKYTMFQKLTNQVADIFLMKSCKFDLMVKNRPTITILRLITLKHPRWSFSK